MSPSKNKYWIYWRLYGKRRQMSMLFITHDLALVSEIADEVIVMRHGEIREQGLAKAV